MNELSDRQKLLLKLIVEKYIEENVAISSLNIKKKKLFAPFSSATIRNEMVVLEKLGFLQKEYSSSGRIPTKRGYQLYIENLMGDWQIKNMTIQKHLTELLSERNESIDITIDKSVELISDFLNLPIIVSKANNQEVELLKKIDITQITPNDFLVFIVSSIGEIYKNQIKIEEFVQREDLNICINMFNERLIDTPLINLDEKIKLLIPELRNRVHQYEFVYTKIIMHLLANINKKQQPTVKIYNSRSIIAQPEVKNNLINLDDIFHILENYSTFSQLKFNYLKTGNTLINLENNIQGLSLATTTVNSPKNTHKLMVIGPNRMNYPLIKYLLEFINEKLICNKENK